MNKVQVWEEKVIIPTYEAGKPDKNPMFLEKRVYQGSSGRIYPHTVIEKISDEKVDKEYTALFLENDYLKVMMLPELGGRIQRAYDKTNGYDFIYYNHVIKPALVGRRDPGYPEVLSSTGRSITDPVPLIRWNIPMRKMRTEVRQSGWERSRICSGQRACWA